MVTSRAPAQIATTRGPQPGGDQPEPK